MHQLNADPYVCHRCKSDKKAQPMDGCPFVKVQVGDKELDVINHFCYLGDMISAGDG